MFHGLAEAVNDTDRQDQARRARSWAKRDHSHSQFALCSDLTERPAIRSLTKNECRLNKNNKRMAMQDIAELERRINAALDRIGSGLDRLPAAPRAASVPPADTKDLARMQAILDEERMVNAQLNERLKTVKEKEALARAELDEKCQRLTRQLDTQGLELQRMRKTAVQLREQLRELREAQVGDMDPQLINRAMQAELEALRATRMTEMAEMEELIAEISPLLDEAPAHA
jgi:hypothetical protein